MNENNLDNTNTIPDVNPNPDNTNVEGAAGNDTGVNMVNPESIIGEVPASSEVVPREEIARIDIAGADNTVNINLMQQPAEEKKENSAFKEKMKQAELNYKPPSKYRMFLLVVFFVFLIAFVLFLPDINKMVVKYKSGEKETQEENITSGTLTCALSSANADLNFDYTNVFTFSDNKLKKTQLTTIIRGDITLDEKTLDEMNEECNSIDANSKGIEGVSIKCDYTGDKLTKKQIFDLSVLDIEKITTAFTEAGSQYHKYLYDQDIREIEKDMYASGFSCKKEAS